VAKDEAVAEELHGARTRVGSTPGALEAWLALRGLRTLPVRLAEQEKTAALLVSRLAEHPAVTKVRYPGFGMMVAFELADAEAADRVCASVPAGPFRDESRRRGKPGGTTRVAAR